MSCRRSSGTLSAVFNCQIGQAAARVEHVRFYQRSCRTGLQARRTVPAAIGHRRVLLELKAAEDHAQHDPRPELGVHEAGVLPDPPETAVPGEDPLLDGTAVHGDPCLERLRLHLAHPCHQVVQVSADQPVVVLASRVPGDQRGVRRSGFDRRPIRAT